MTEKQYTIIMIIVFAIAIVAVADARHGLDALYEYIGYDRWSR